MKYNFVVSNLKELWISQNKKLFIVEPYVYQTLKSDDLLQNYDEVIVIPHRRKNKEDLYNDYQFVMRKYEKYVPIMSQRLNKIHRTNYSNKFWQKSLSVSFIRDITITYDLYQICKLNFNPDKHECKIISKNSYITPSDYEFHRNLFQNSSFGQEQLFSQYIHLFFVNVVNSLHAKYESKSSPKIKIANIKKVFAELKKINISKIKKILLTFFYKNNKHNTWILGSFFSASYVVKLILRSKGKIYPVGNNIFTNIVVDNAKIYNIRKIISSFDDNFDEFDNYFFSSLEYNFPKSYLENFKNIEQKCKTIIDSNPDLNYVINESWLSDTYISIALAIMSEYGIKHVFNEHNYISHPWLGSEIYHSAKLVDIFVSQGWGSNEIPNLVKGASLFEFDIRQKTKKSIKVSYIAVIPLVKFPQFSGSYGFCEEGAIKYFEFITDFFSNLSVDTLEVMLFKDYPLSVSSKWLYYKHEWFISAYLKVVKKPENPYQPAKELMSNSEIVVVDYISTAHLEALHMNIPTIFFWNKDSYFIDDKFKDHFKDLIDVGICQTNPKKAAMFLETILDDPKSWWQKESVQKARLNYLKNNFGEPKTVINYYLNLSGINK